MLVKRTYLDGISSKLFLKFDSDFPSPYGWITRREDKLFDPPIHEDIPNVSNTFRNPAYFIPKFEYNDQVQSAILCGADNCFVI